MIKENINYGFREYNDEIWKWTVNESIPSLLNLLDRRVSLAVLGINLSGICKDKIAIVSNRTGFPIATIIGRSNTGKSLYASYLDRLNGGNCIRSFNETTYNTLIKELAEERKATYIVDDFNDRQVVRRIKEFYGLLYVAYSSDVICKGKRDLSVEKFKLHRPITIISQYPISWERLDDKIIRVHFPHMKFSDYTNKKLNALDLSYFYEGFLKFSDRLYETGRFQEIFRQAEEIAKSFSIEKEFTEMGIYNMSILVLGALIIRELLSFVGSSFKITDDDIRDMLIHISYGQVRC